MLIASARAEAVDEVEAVEILLGSLAPPVSTEELQSWGDLLRRLGYRQVGVMMKRMSRRAPSRPQLSVIERVRARRAARSTFKT